MEEDINGLLYTDEEGEYIGIEEVQLLEPYPVERVEPLKSLLVARDKVIALEAALILCAWGIEDGVSFIDNFLDQSNHTEVFFPHRHYEEDNVYDEISHSINVYRISSGNHTGVSSPFLVRF